MINKKKYINFCIFLSYKIIKDIIKYYSNIFPIFFIFYSIKIKVYNLVDLIVYS
jgi:hypothetical protein